MPTGPHTFSRVAFLSGNMLKLLAAVFMTIDHMGLLLFPGVPQFRIIGRLAMPLYAFCIAEGCRYTRSRPRYFFTMLGLGVLFQVIYTLFSGSLYLSILITFSISILIIYAIDTAKDQRLSPYLRYLPLLALTANALFLAEGLPRMLPDYDLCVDYGFFGILLPPLIYISEDRPKQLLSAAVGLILVGWSLGGIQWYALFSLPLLFLYNGKRGKVNMKLFFYIYYPLHLVVLQVIAFAT